MTRRIALLIEYEGTRYAGWQAQQNAPSVQRVLEKALYGLTGETAGVTGASRTDAGVHALGQVAHFDTVSRIPPDKFSFALNTRLPADVRVTASGQAPPQFHARFDAAGKVYAYRVLNRPHNGALTRLTHWHVPVLLDDGAMQRAARALTGRHDFSSFMAAGGSAKTFTRTLFDVQLSRRGQELCLMVWGDGFLYNMVRILAGTLVAIGQGKLAEDCVQRALRRRDRLLLGPTAPAHGLTLMRVLYAGQEEIARKTLAQPF